MNETKNRADSKFFADSEKQYFQGFGLQDIDTAVFNWLKNLELAIESEDGTKQDAHIVFTTAEKWSKAEKELGILDSKKRAEFPLISIFRNKFTPNLNRYVYNTNATRTTVLREPIKDQSINYRRKYTNPATRANVNKTIYRIISIPYPRFVDLPYDIKVNTNFTTHMNQIIEQIFRKYFIWVESEKGFAFHASLSEPTFTELEDQKTNEHIIKAEFQILAESYIILKDLMNKPIQTFRIDETKTGMEIEESIVEHFNPPLGKIPVKLLAQS